MPAFKGVPISSRGQLEIPVEVVSQSSVVDIDKTLDEQYSKKEVDAAEAVPERKVPLAAEAATGVDVPKEETKTAVEVKAEAVRSGQIKVSELAQVDFDDFMHSSIVALPKRLPTMLDVRAKDPNFRLRWVNFKADGGRRVDECRAMGFTVAKTEEVQGLEEASIMLHPDGIKYHDVLLMKVPTKLLFGWLKQNALESMRAVSPKFLHKAAKAEGERTLRQGIMNEGRSYNDMKDKIGIYVPGEGEVPN
jgi:hypothetical protein